MTDSPSPKTLTEILAADFRPFTDSDWEIFAGCEGDHPMIAEMSEELVAIMDETGDEIIIQLHYTPEFGAAACWGWTLPKSPVQLV